QPGDAPGRELLAGEWGGKFRVGREDDAAGRTLRHGSSLGTEIGDETQPLARALPADREGTAGVRAGEAPGVQLENPRRDLGAADLEQPPVKGEGAVADLIVVLEEVDERARRQVGGALPPRPAEVARYLALVDEALCEAASEQGVRVPGIVGVVRLALTGQQHVQTVMRVVVPL